MKRLTLLSGGEKSMTALAFLFAVFLARPCPFYILDEVEAALDDLNIDRFLELLRAYADRAQFIVVTHQKRTMEAADTLYGVSMGDDGVSKVVSRRLPREAAAEAARPRSTPVVWRRTPAGRKRPLFDSTAPPDPLLERRRLRSRRTVAFDQEPAHAKVARRVLVVAVVAIGAPSRGQRRVRQEHDQPASEQDASWRSTTRR